MNYNGRITSDNTVLGVRVLSRDDLAILREPRAQPTIAAIRDPHHRLARLLAAGLKITEAAPRAGYSYVRASLLTKDPSFIELIEHYRAIVTAKWAEAVDDYMEMATANMVKAERQIADKLEAADEVGETLPTRDLIAISRDAADRFGYGKKNTTLNVNVDFAAKLENARKRSQRVIESTVVASELAVSSSRTVDQQASAQPHLRRRA